MNRALACRSGNPIADSEYTSDGWCVCHGCGGLHVLADGCFGDCRLYHSRSSATHPDGRFDGQAVERVRSSDRGSVVYRPRHPVVTNPRRLVTARFQAGTPLFVEAPLRFRCVIPLVCFRSSGVRTPEVTPPATAVWCERSRGWGGNLTGRDPEIPWDEVLPGLENRITRQCESYDYSYSSLSHWDVTGFTVSKKRKEKDEDGQDRDVRDVTVNVAYGCHHQ